MSLRASVQGIPGTVLFDSGAGISAVSSAFVGQHKLQVQPTQHASVTLADGSSVPVLGTTFVELTLQRIKLRVRCLVLQLSLDWTVILGEDWLKQARALLDYKTMSISGYANKSRPFVLRCSQDSEPLAGSSCDDLHTLVL